MWLPRPLEPASPTTRPLSGMRVLDFTTLLPGPLATLLLAEAGADVIKIERPGGEEMRAYHPRWGADGANFALLNRGKRGLVLDLKSQADRERAFALAAEADVVVEQFRPGVMARLGLGPDALRTANPRLVVCSITGYGQTGPDADRAGHDVNYMADAGLLALAMGPPGARTIPPVLVADIAGGAYPAVMNILMALRRRDLTGEGAVLDVAMADNLFPFAFWALGQGLAGAGWPGNGDALLSGGSPRYRLYDTADGRVVACGALEEKFWRAFTEAIGLAPELRDDRRDPEATGRAVAALISAAPADHWRTVFREADCCATVVATLEEALASPHFSARGVFARTVTNERGDRLPALPVPIDPAFRGEQMELPFPALAEEAAPAPVK